MDKGELGIRRVEGGGRRKEIGGRIVRGNREEGGGLRGEVVSENEGGVVSENRERRGRSKS